MLFHFLFGIMVVELTPAFQSSAETMETRLAPRNRPETWSTSALCKFCLEMYVNVLPTPFGPQFQVCYGHGHHGQRDLSKIGWTILVIQA